MSKSTADSRQQILDAALRQFAAKGYAGASMRDIIAATPFTLPTIYYHFGSKAGIYQALVESAHDEAYQRMQAAAARAPDLEAQLVEIAVAMFDFVRERRELTRLALATAFAAPEELPEAVRDSRKRQRILDSFEQLMTRALKAGTLSRQFDACELAEGIYAAITLQVMRSLLGPQQPPTRRKAERMVRLFLHGAGLD